MNNLVSVIVPFYGHSAEQLSTAVRSALGQNHKDIEVIVVDDASPLPACSALKEVEDSRLNIFRSDFNQGGGLARNIGISQASGEFLAFLDSDDKWFPEKISTQLAYWRRFNLFDDSVLFCRHRIIEGTRKWIRPRRALAKSERVGEYLFVHRELMQTSGLFLRTDFARKVLFDDLKRHQDYQFCLALEAAGARFELVPDVLYEFIQTPKINDPELSLYFLKNYPQFFDKETTRCFIALTVVRSMLKQGHLMEAAKVSLRFRAYSAFGDFLRIYAKKFWFERFN